MVLRYTLLKWIPGWFDMFNHNVVACVRDAWRGLSGSGKPGDGIPYGAKDDHVDKAFSGDWPNDDFKGGRNATQRLDGDSQKTSSRPPPPSYEQAKQMDEPRKGEEKTSIDIQFQVYSPPPPPPSLPPHTSIRSAPMHDPVAPKADKARVA